MDVPLLRRGRVSLGVVFVLSLFLVGVMMCSVILLVSPAGHSFFVAGCDQVSMLMNYVTIEGGYELLLMFAVLGVMAMLDSRWQLRDVLKKRERGLLNREKQSEARVAADYILRIFREGVIRNLSYN